MEIYANQSADWILKTRSSASATFDFITDSDYITLKLDLLPGSSQKYGTNDYSRTDDIAAYGEKSGRYIRRLAELFPDTPIVGILPIYRGDENHFIRTFYRTYTLDEARELLRRQYMALPNGYVVEETGIPHLLQFFAPDLLHPNELGFTLMAQGITNRLKEIIG